MPTNEMRASASTLAQAALGGAFLVTVSVLAIRAMGAPATIAFVLFVGVLARQIARQLPRRRPVEWGLMAVALLVLCSASSFGWVGLAVSLPVCVIIHRTVSLRTRST